MPTVSGNIGDPIAFDVSGAGAVTGVYFGEGLGTYEIINDSRINAVVPETANWQKVSFYKRNNITAHSIFGTGTLNSGALSNLESEISAGGFTSCTSGDITYSNIYEASGICTLSATGASQAYVSGQVYSGFNSGMCGDNTNGYQNSGYSASTSRVNNFNTFVDSSGNWLAVGNVEYTGNFDSKKASLEIECPTANIEETSYKFVPIPQITSFLPAEGVSGESLIISGRALSGISSVSMSGVQMPFQVLSNYKISGTILDGDFDNQILISGASGVFTSSAENFKTFKGLETGVTIPNLSLGAGQNKIRSKGHQSNVKFFGQALSGLTTGYLIDEQNEKIDLLSDSSFFYSGGFVSLPVSGLDEGYYGLVVENITASGYLKNALRIVDGPSVFYAFNSIYTADLIVEPQEYSSASELSTALANKSYDFPVDQDANRICLTFDNLPINSGYLTYELQKYTSNPAFVGVNSSLLYYIEGTGESSTLSSQAALDKFNLGQYTRDVYGNLYNDVSYKLDCNCIVTDTNTISTSSSTSYPDVSLAASGYSLSLNTGSINDQLTAHTGYQVTTWTNAGPRYARDEHNYQSGISWPYSDSDISNHSHANWENLLHSGLNILSGDGGGMYNLTSGYSLVNSGSFNTGTLSYPFGNESAIISQINSTMSSGYSQCATGNYATQITGLTETRSITGYFYGYC